MKETEFQTIFSNYNKVKKILGNFELKVARNGRISISDFEDHQIPALISAQESGYQHKYSDADPRLKAFDYSSNPPLIGYIVVKFDKYFYIITVNNFVYKLEKLNKKSLKEVDCEKICTLKVKL